MLTTDTRHRRPVEDEDSGDASGRTPLVTDLLAVMRRQWQLALGVWLLVMGLAVGVLFALPREFESTARFLVKNARQDLVVGPTDSQSVMYRDDVAEEIINTELELLRGRDILARVVRDLRLDQSYVEHGIDPSQASERAIRDLGRGLTAATIRKTNLIQVSYMNTDPALASSVLTQLSDAYLEAHLVMHSSPGSYEVFKRQEEQANQELQRAQEELAAMARSANLLIPDEQKREVMAALSATEAQYAALKGEIRDAAARVRASQQKMQQVPRRVQSEVRNLPNQESVDRFTTMILEMKNQRTELLTKFTADDRRVLQLDQQIADTTAALAAAKTMSVDQQSTNVNPAWVELEGESLKAQLALAGLVSKETELRKLLDQYRARSLELADAIPEYEAVARKVAREQANYVLYTKKGEEARIVEALDRQRISNVVLAQAPFVSSVPSTPDWRLGLIIGASTASALGALAALCAEHLMATPFFARRRRRSLDLDGDPSSPAVVLS